MLTEISVAAVIVIVCLLLHVAGILLMAEWVLQYRQYFEQQGARIHVSFLMIILFSGIMLLHVAEASLWAVFYYSRELFPDFETSLYFSLVSYAAIGYGDVLLPRNWRLLGAIEGVSGLLLCGISTAFIFAVINVMFKARIQQQQSRWQSTLELTRHCKK
jgi:voltage-gated potassium channel